MDILYLFVCGIRWAKYDDQEAGWELIQALSSPDADCRLVAEAMLARNGVRVEAKSNSLYARHRDVRVSNDAALEPCGIGADKNDE